MRLLGKRIVFARFKDHALKNEIESLGAKVAQGTVPTVKETSMEQDHDIQTFDLKGIHFCKI